MWLVMIWGQIPLTLVDIRGLQGDMYTWIAWAELFCSSTPIHLKIESPDREPAYPTVMVR